MWVVGKRKKQYQVDCGLQSEGWLTYRDPIDKVQDLNNASQYVRLTFMGQDRCVISSPKWGNKTTNNQFPFNFPKPDQVPGKYFYK